MDERVTDNDADVAENPSVEAGVSPADLPGAADTAATTGVDQASPPPPIDVNELIKVSPKQLRDLAKNLGLRLFDARSRHGHIADIVRAALGRGGTVTAEGFLDFNAESPVGTLRF